MSANNLPRAPDAVVRQVREAYAAGRGTAVEIGELFGVPAGTVLNWTTGRARVAAGGPISKGIRPKHTRGNDVTSDYDVDERGCWIWRGRLDKRGYPHVQRNGERWGAHRLAWTLANGPIPDGMTVDHLCFTPACVNPHHLQLLTHSENSRRRRNILRETCVRGHARTPENTSYNTNGAGRPGRVCLPCRREREQAARASKWRVA